MSIIVDKEEISNKDFKKREIKKMEKITNQTRICTLAELAGFCSGICEGCEFELEDKKNCKEYENSKEYLER